MDVTGQCGDDNLYSSSILIYFVYEMMIGKNLIIHTTGRPGEEGGKAEWVSNIS